MPRRVLVVDDERDILDLLTIWLTDDARCTAVDHALDLGTAVELATERQPDTILLDLNVGPVTSTDTIPQLRSACPTARIIVHTGNTEAAHAADVLRVGADIVVEKATVSIVDVVEAALAEDLAS